MKANQLMVGDLVQTKEIGTFEKLNPRFQRQVNAIKDFGIVELSFFDRFGNKCYANERYENIEPIPLKAEHLENNGFQMNEVVNMTFPKGTKQWSYEDDECTIYVSENGIIWWLEIELKEYAGRIEMSLSDIHELQHAMKLFGISKKIAL